jgi:hypothetical protein
MKPKPQGFFLRLTLTHSLNQLDLETQQNRRENLSTKFFQNNLGNAHFQDYPPERHATNYELRCNNLYKHYRCHTERFKNSFFPQRILKQ